MDASDQREYGYRIPVLIIGFFAAFLLLLAFELPGYVEQRQWGVVGPAVFMAAWMLPSAIRRFLLDVRGRVLVLSDAVLVRGAWGPERRVFWDDVEELRVTYVWFAPFSLGHDWPYAQLTTTDGHTLRLGQGVEHLESLTKTIASRAGLTETYAQPRYLIHRRPSG